MKNCKIITKEKFLDYNKTIRNALLRGEIISGITKTINGDLMAKFTKTSIDNMRYYAIWEKDLLEGKWHLLQFGRKKEIEPEWKEFVGFWREQYENNVKLTA